MKLETRLILIFILRIVFLVFAAWVALMPETLPEAHVIVRIALASTFLVVSILVGEVAKLHTQFDMLLRAVRAAGAKVTEEAAPRDDRAAMTILIRALGSREASTREKAHKNLVRLTGQDLPPDPTAWEAWWKEAQAKSGASGEEE